jgi:hypothetical protein
VTTTPKHRTIHAHGYTTSLEVNPDGRTSFILTHDRFGSIVSWSDDYDSEAAALNAATTIIECRLRQAAPHGIMAAAFKATVRAVSHMAAFKATVRATPWHPADTTQVLKYATACADAYASGLVDDKFQPWPEVHRHATRMVALFTTPANNDYPDQVLVDAANAWRDVVSRTAL